MNISEITKMDKPYLSVIILAYNEETNIEMCLKSICDIAADIYVVDSFSEDRTLEIARRYTDKIFQHSFENYAKQFNWALNTLPFRTDWIMRLDADERLSPELKQEIVYILKNIDLGVSGIYLKRRIYFMDKWMRHGDSYPIWHLRIWRSGHGFCEERWMDEHIRITKGASTRLNNGDIVDHNNKSLTWWIDKHNNYATRECIDLLNEKHHFLKGATIASSLLGAQEQRKRWIKKNVYCNLPLFVRPLFYFLYRFILKFGFLDGKEGLAWHFLQGFWYRFLVDVKIYEIEKLASKNGKSIKTVIQELHGIIVDDHA